jgi:hypothetical protein
MRLWVHEMRMPWDGDSGHRLGQGMWQILQWGNGTGFVCRPLRLTLNTQQITHLFQARSADGNALDRGQVQQA